MTAEGAPASGAARPGAVGRNAAIASASQVATMVVGALLALLVAALIGNNAETDGFFAAYGVYSLGVLLAQAARTTVLPRLLEGETRFGALDIYFGGGLVLGAVAVFLLVPLGGVIAELVTGDLPDSAHDAARTALLLLAPAVVAQLYAGLGAAMLAALDDFLSPGIAFLAGGAVSVAVFVAVEPALGVDGIGVGLLAGSGVSAAVVGVALARKGWRPSLDTFAGPRPMGRAAAVLVVASLPILISHVGYLITLSIGARIGEGVVTAFSYSYLGYIVAFALLAGSVPLAIIGPLTEHWDRRPETLVEDNERVFRAGLVLFVPLVVGIWLVGHEVAGALLSKFNAAEVDLTVDMFLILSPLIAFGLVQAVPYSAVLIVGRYRAIAIVTAGAVVVQVSLALIAGEMGEERLLAAAFTAASTLNLVTTLFLVSRRYPAIVAPTLLRALIPMALIAGAAFGLPALAAHALDLPATDWIALAAGLAVYAALVAAVRPIERDLAVRIARTALPIGA